MVKKRFSGGSGRVHLGFLLGLFGVQLRIGQGAIKVRIGLRYGVSRVSGKV